MARSSSSANSTLRAAGTDSSPGTRMAGIGSQGAGSGSTLPTSGVPKAAFDRACANARSSPGGVTSEEEAKPSRLSTTTRTPTPRVSAEVRVSTSPPYTATEVATPCTA